MVVLYCSMRQTYEAISFMCNVFWVWKSNTKPMKEKGPRIDTCPFKSASHCPADLRLQGSAAKSDGQWGQWENLHQGKIIIGGDGQ